MRSVEKCRLEIVDIVEENLESEGDQERLLAVGGSKTDEQVQEEKSAEEQKQKQEVEEEEKKDQSDQPV